MKTLKDIDLFVFDVDGVLTDNKIYTNTLGVEEMVFNRGDGLGIEIIKKIPADVLFLTSEATGPANRRAEKLEVNCISTHGKGKLKPLKSFLRTFEYSPDRVCFTGNDYNDFEIMKYLNDKGGICFSPANCYYPINEHSIVLGAKGGEGVVREILYHLDPEYYKIFIPTKEAEAERFTI